MLSDNYIQVQSALLKGLGDRLGYEVSFCNEYLKSSNPQIEKEWISSVRASCNYGAFLIKLFLASIDEYRKLSEEQFGYYVGKISIQPFLEVINSYEQIINKLIDNNENLKYMLDARVESSVKLISENWQSDAKGKSKKLEKSLKSYLQRKIHEMAFIRDALYSEDVINKVDHEILFFAWDIRNSMHHNFVAIKDIDFSYPDIKTGKQYHFKFKKGEELYHPGDLVSFHIITEQIIFILLKILQTYRDKKADD